MPDQISLEKLQQHRTAAYAQSPGEAVTSKDAALDFVNRRGFVFFWPIRGIELPSLWGAVAGNRPVAADHDDAGHVTWGWKDQMLEARAWYYAKVLRQRATMISLTMAPNFYALSENYGSPEEDYLQQYAAGTISRETRLVYEALLESGPLDTVALRKAAHLTSRSADYRFGRALTELQSDFKILPVGVADAGAWHYAFVYDLVPRVFPEIVEQARWIGERQARRAILACYFQSVGAARLPDLQKLFRWPREALRSGIETLQTEQLLSDEVGLEGSSGKWLALPVLLQRTARRGR